MHPPPASPKKGHSFQALLLNPVVPGGTLPPVSPPPRRLPPSSETVRIAPTSSRARSDSHVRLRALGTPSLPVADLAFIDAADFLDELGEDQLILTMSLACLGEAVGLAPRDPSARALRDLEARITDLGDLRDALIRVQGACVDPRLQRLVVPEAPLADYLRGLYAWAHAVVRALEQLAAAMRTLQPDWALLRWRLEEAKNFHFDELHDAVRADLHAVTTVANSGGFGGAPPPVEDLHFAVHHLFATATTLEIRLDQRFG